MAKSAEMSKKWDKRYKYVAWWDEMVYTSAIAAPMWQQRTSNNEGSREVSAPL